MRHIAPILAALKKHKAGAILIALQIALTLAVVSNALCIILQRIDRANRPTGMIESNLLTVQSGFVGVNLRDLPSMVNADLMTLRQLPGVEDASVTSAFPLSEDSWPEGIRLDPGARDRAARSELYFVDDHALAVMGGRLIAGRNFRADEIQTGYENNIEWPSQVIITKALADKLYPNGSALQKPIYIGNNNSSPSTVVGIVDRLQASWSRADSYDYMNYATLLPMRLMRSDSTYLIRARPGQLEALRQSVPAALIKLDRMRIFTKDSVRTFETVRKQIYRSEHGIAVLMGSVSLVLLGITASGILGLTSFWVGQRRKQIGVRRALGATRSDILSYFLIENLLLGIGGVLVGTLLAIGLNIWLMNSFELTRLSPMYVLVGTAALLLLGQSAVLAPAMRASRVSPAESTRST